MSIGMIAGVELSITPLFLLSLFVCLLSGVLGETLVLFVCVMVHEASHCIVAASMGLRVRRIELLPFGGVAYIEGMSAAGPLHEVAIALCGPAVNVLLAMGAVFLQEYAGLPFDITAFVQINLMLAAFNLLPALPLDGGRCVRALLSIKLGMKKASSILVAVTYIWAALLLSLGILLLFWGRFVFSAFAVALFLFSAAWRERRNSYLMQFEAYSARDTRIRRGETLPVRQIAAESNVTVERIIRKTAPGMFYLITVVEKGRRLGQVDDGEVFGAYLHRGPNTTLKELLTM
ncbi:MAG: M50 family metallopeptidase [Christensenellales bacterium]